LAALKRLNLNFFRAAKAPSVPLTLNVTWHDGAILAQSGTVLGGGAQLIAPISLQAQLFSIRLPI
jgi:hypothetical protein